MTVTDLAREWGISVTRVWKLVHEGRLDQWLTKATINGRTYYEIDPQAIHHRPPDRRKKRTDETA